MIEARGEVISTRSTTASESVRSLGAGSLESLNMDDERRLRALGGPTCEVARNCGILGRDVSRGPKGSEAVAGEDRGAVLTGVCGIVKLCFCARVVSTGRYNLDSQLALCLNVRAIQTYAGGWSRDSLID